MRTYYGSGRGSHHWPYQCEFHSSDAWLLVDAVVTIIAAAMTIVVIGVRHPVKALLAALVLRVLGLASGWW